MKTLKSLRPQYEASDYEQRRFLADQFTRDLGTVRRYVPVRDIACAIHRVLTPRERYELIHYLNRPRL